jgi:hypothetical protein
MKLWLVPASDAAATANVPKTLSEPISEGARRSANLTAENCRYAWGTRSGIHNDNKLRSMAAGDLCLFYTSEAGRNQYNWIAKISDVRRSPEISEALWDTPDFEWIYFLDKPSKINLSVDQLAREIAQFRPDYLTRAPMGIMPLDPDVLQQMMQARGDVAQWLKTKFGVQPQIRDEFLTIMRRYYDQHTVFYSARRGAHYAIQDVDEGGCTVMRLDGGDSVRCTTEQLGEKLQLLRNKGGIHPFDDSFSSTSAIRNCLLQAKNLALTADQLDIVEVSAPERALEIFNDTVRSLRIDESSGEPKLYKPAMIACVLEGLDDGELTENIISFDWIVPRFVKKMASLGEQVGEREAAMPFFHLTGDLFWMLSYHDLGQLVSDGREGPKAIRSKVSHASIKDTFWDALQQPAFRQRAEQALADKWWPQEKLPRFWVEKTIIANRPDRQVGENALGRALWSPQTAEDGKEIYRAMLEVRPGDIVFHFVDNQRVDSFSTVAKPADPSFVGIVGTDWAGRPAYRVELKDHQALVPPIDRAEFLGEGGYRPLVQELLNTERGLFFNREFNLNQGAYITEAPLALIRIWNDIHMRKTGSPIRSEWNLPLLTSGGARNVHYWKIAPGENASYWKECQDGGFIAIGWDELGDVSKMTRQQFVKRRDELVKQHKWNAVRLDQVWKFHEIQAGDRIVANRGTEHVVGIGTVTGPYYFVSDESYAHRLPVRWDDLRERTVNENGWRRALIEIDQAKFLDISKAPIIQSDIPSVRETPPVTNPDYSLADCAKDTGFEIATLRRWKRGLDRKGQAIFYGPPGTGKTFVAEKLAAHLVGGTDGIRELVQFHPAYSYEDFMQGI